MSKPAGVGDVQTSEPQNIIVTTGDESLASVPGNAISKKAASSPVAPRQGTWNSASTPSSSSLGTSSSSSNKPQPFSSTSLHRAQEAGMNPGHHREIERWHVMAGAAIILVVLAVAMGSLHQKNKRRRERENMSAQDMRRKRLALLLDHQGNTDGTTEQSTAQPRTSSTIGSDHSTDTVTSGVEETDKFSKRSPPPLGRNLTAARAGRVDKPETRKDSKKEPEADDRTVSKRRHESPLSAMTANDGHDDKGGGGGGGVAAECDSSFPPVKPSKPTPFGTQLVSQSAAGVEALSQSDEEAQQQEKVSPPMPPSPSSGSAQEIDLPGGMQLDGLLELLRSGPGAAFGAIASVVSPTGLGDESTPGGRFAGRGTPADTCRRWWDAAWRAGDADAAIVAAEAFNLQLGLLQDDIFTTADEHRAAIMVAFLRASPHPLMVRRVFLANPPAALSALQLAIKVPLQRYKLPPSAQVPRGGTPAIVVDATLRMESFQPLEGLDSLVGLLQSPAGSVALSTVLGLEARQEYAHGADFEAQSCLGPLLAALPCALSLKEHTRVSTDTLKETLAGTSVTLPPARVPVAHRLAKMVAELKDPRVSRHTKGLMHQFNTYLKQVSRNRQTFVELTQAALVKAMTTKGLASETKSDVYAWLTKAIYLHESLPRLCDEHAPELLGDPRSGVTSASSAFLMSLSALLLRLGSRKFAKVDDEILDSIDPSYLEFGSVRFDSGVPSASDALADDEPEDGDDGDGHDYRQQGGKIHDTEENKVGVEAGSTAATSRAEGGGGIEEEKGEFIPGTGNDGGNTVSVTAAAAAADVTVAAAAAATATSRIEEPVSNEEDSNAPSTRQGHGQQPSLAVTPVLVGASREAKKDGVGVFSFATELFFLTHRALEVIVSSMRRREAEARRVLDQISVSSTGASIRDDVDNEAGDDAEVTAARDRSQRLMFKETDDALNYGWAVEGLGSDAVLGVAVQFANFTARWLDRQIQRRGDLSESRVTSYSSPAIGDNAVETSSAEAGTLARIPHAFIATICDTWVSAGRRGRQGQFVSQREANNAASFCGRLMERNAQEVLLQTDANPQVDLGFSAPTQAKLVDVFEEFIQTGERALERAKKSRRLRGSRNTGLGSGPGLGFGEGEGFDEVRKARSGGFQGSMYWGAQRGFAGAIMDDETLRRALPRQLMVLHASVSSVEGLAAEFYLGFFKFGVMKRIGHILLKLWSHPLGEPRQAILALFREAMQDASTSSTATATSAVASVVDSAIPITSNFVASDFVNGVFDVLMYFLNDARDRLRDGVIEERSNDGRELNVGHPHWNKYERERQQCKGVVSGMVLPNVQLLHTLCVECEVLDLLRVGKLGLRSAAIISLILRTLYGEEAVEYAVADPHSWGIDKPKLGGLTCQLLAGLAGPGIKKTKAFAAALKSIAADFDIRLLEATAIAPGCECLRGPVITRLALALELEGERMKVREAEEAMSGGKGGGEAMSADDPFEGVPEDIDTEELAKAYGEALGDLVHTQVESLSPGHNYDRRREGSTLNTPRKVASELTRKLPRMLPNPPHPDSSIFAILEEDALNFARFLITGPVGTPYEGGLFVFDVFLPQNYPKDPPLVSMITTGQGTVKFNPNLYSDGKVCLSLLGKETGASVAGSDKWDPEKSSLWQVFASIQTQVMTEDPYYNQGGGRSHMRGKGTDETEQASADENARITLETIRHAAVANLRNPPKGCEEIIRTHFRTMRGRILRRCKETCERAPNKRLGKATLKASMELRAELDRLEEV